MARKKKRTSWNKGIKVPKELREQISEKLQGRAPWNKDKQFCPKGHDTFECGRTKHGNCNDCRKGLNLPRPKVQFCPKGHDTFVTGRRKNGNCIKCQQDRIAALSQLRKATPKIKNPMCPQGHNKDEVGRSKCGACMECKRISEKEHYVPHPRTRKQICVHGHDTAICGRNTNSVCKDCLKIYHLTRNKNGKNTDYYLRKHYGITKTDFDNMMKKQNSLCLGCKRNHIDLKKGLCVDHDHITGKVRGLLCNDCNTILGMAKDNVEVLQALAVYLIDSKKI
jgi:hypothetical protein